MAKSTLTGVANRRRPSQVRLAAAIALGRIDPKMSDRILEKLAQISGNGRVRIDAALAGPKPKVLPLVAGIVGDWQERDDDVAATGALRSWNGTTIKDGCC